MMPFGVAVGRNGDIFVTDSAAQRIWRIRGGIATVLAGSGPPVDGNLWVKGGYAQHPARFNQPVGIVASPDSGVYVADSMNHVIRKIDAMGNVSVYAGSPASAGSADGSRLSATFTRPFALAIDKRGNLYVSDLGVGIRRISASSGQVTTLPIPIKDATGVSISPGGNGSLFVACPRGIYIDRYPPLDDTPWTPNKDNFNWIPNVANRKPGDVFTMTDVGTPLMIVALNDTYVVYTDAVTGSVRKYDVYEGHVAPIVGQWGDDYWNDAAGYADGPGDKARMSQPAGIAVDRDGSLIVADSGNRRIRRISPINLRSAVWSEGAAVAPARDPAKEFRISHVGNSFIYDDDWDTSEQRYLEDGLNKSHFAAGKHVGVVPFRVITRQYSADLTYIDDVIDNTNTDAVLLQLNALQFDGSSTNWTEVKSRLAATARRLHTLGIPLTVVIEPMAYEFAPDEWIQHFMGAGWDENFPQSEVREPLLKICSELGLPHIDLLAGLIREEGLPEHRPMYGTFDKHINAAGRKFVAGEILKALQSQPLKSYVLSSKSAEKSQP